MDPSVHEKAHLKRGKACYHCRTRKTRCDGALPSCGPCVRSECVDDCEYVSLGQKARVQILQEQIMDIEAKIRRRANDKRQSAPKRKEKSRDASLSASISPSSRSSSSMSSLPCASSPADSFSPRSPPSLSSTSPSSPQARDPIEPFPPEAFTEVIPLHVAHVFWDTFFAHATDFCFFLDEALNKFRPIAGRPSCMSPALTATIYLLSAHILAHPSMDNLESFLVSTACNLLPKELAMPTVNVAEVLQAELLLAQYFFARDRHTEARFHMSVALGLAFGCGLPEQVCPGLDPIRSRTAYLFLLSLDNAWSTALGYASHEPLSSALRDCECKVLNDVWSTSGFPGHAVLLTKSVSLWQGVEELITTPLQFGDLLERSENLEKLIQSWLLELDDYEAENRDGGALSRVLLFAGTITHYAFMKLRRLVWARKTPEDFLHSACAIVHKIIAAVDKEPITYMNPLMGRIWHSVYALVSHEISRRGTPGEDASELGMALSSGLAAVSTLPNSCYFAREFSLLYIPS